MQLDSDNVKLCGIKLSVWDFQRGCLCRVVILGTNLQLWENFFC